jgi:hypothetical protein
MPCYCSAAPHWPGCARPARPGFRADVDSPPHARQPNLRPPATTGVRFSSYSCSPAPNAGGSLGAERSCARSTAQEPERPLAKQAGREGQQNYLVRLPSRRRQPDPSNHHAEQREDQPSLGRDRSLTGQPAPNPAQSRGVHPLRSHPPQESVRVVTGGPLRSCGCLYSDTCAPAPVYIPPFLDTL